MGRRYRSRGRASGEAVDADSRGPSGNRVTRLTDVWDPPRGADIDPGRRVTDDPRAGKVTCQRCGVEVTHVQVGGRWHTRTLDGLPHPPWSCR